MQTTEPHLHWDNRAREFSNSHGGYKATCSYGAPYLYNKYIDLIQKKAYFSALRDIPVKNRQVLDIGCGVGRWSRIFASRGAQVTGADISKEMIRTAKELTKTEPINFVNAPASKIDLPSQSFDLVTCVTVLQHILDPEEFKRSVENMVRMTKKGGKIVIMEVAPSMLNKSRLFNEFLTVRTEKDYLAAFETAGATLENIRSMDIMPLKQILIAFSKKMPQPIYRFLLCASVILSFPVDWLFAGTGLLTRHSWHKVFQFTVR